MLNVEQERPATVHMFIEAIEHFISSNRNALEVERLLSCVGAPTERPRALGFRFPEGESVRNSAQNEGTFSSAV